jgi:hypothetical protein
MRARWHRNDRFTLNVGVRRMCASFILACELLQLIDRWVRAPIFCTCHPRMLLPTDSARSEQRTPENCDQPVIED